MYADANAWATVSAADIETPAGNPNPTMKHATATDLLSNAHSAALMSFGSNQPSRPKPYVLSVTPIQSKRGEIATPTIRKAHIVRIAKATWR